MGLEPMGYTAANRRTIKLMVEQAAPLFEDGSAPMFMNMATAVIEVAVGKLFYAIAPIGDPNAGKKRLFLRVNTAPYYEDQGDAAAPGSQAQIDAAAALNQAAVEAVEARQDDVEFTLSGALSSSSYRPTPADGADLPIDTYFLAPNAGDVGAVWVYQRVAGAPGYLAIHRQEFSADQIADGETNVSMTVGEREAVKIISGSAVPVLGTGAITVDLSEKKITSTGTLYLQDGGRSVVIPAGQNVDMAASNVAAIQLIYVDVITGSLGSVQTGSDIPDGSRLVAIAYGAIILPALSFGGGSTLALITAAGATVYVADQINADIKRDYQPLHTTGSVVIDRQAGTLVVAGSPQIITVNGALGLTNGTTALPTATATLYAYRQASGAVGVGTTVPKSAHLFAALIPVAGGDYCIANAPAGNLTYRNNSGALVNVRWGRKRGVAYGALHSSGGITINRQAGTITTIGSTGFLMTELGRWTVTSGQTVALPVTNNTLFVYVNPNGTIGVTEDAEVPDGTVLLATVISAAGGDYTMANAPHGNLVHLNASGVSTQIRYGAPPGAGTDMPLVSNNGTGDITINLQTGTVSTSATGNIQLTYSAGLKAITANQSVPISGFTAAGNMHIIWANFATGAIGAVQNGALPAGAICIAIVYAQQLVTASQRRVFKLIDSNGYPVNPYASNYKQFVPTDTRLILPDDMFFIAGRKLPIFKDSILPELDPLLYEASRVALLTNQMPADGSSPYRAIRDEINLSDTDLNSTFFVGVENGTVDQRYVKSIVKRVVAQAALTGKSPKILVIGDSQSEYAMVAVLNDILTGLGMTPTFVGTFAATTNPRPGGGNFLAEARAGWKLRNLVGRDSSYGGTAMTVGTPSIGGTTTRAQNPFLRLATGADYAAHPERCFLLAPNAIRNVTYAENGGAPGDYYIFDFSYYLSAWAVDTPDIAIVALGTNDIITDLAAGGPGSTSYTVTEAISFAAASLDIIVRSIREASPAIKVGVSPLPTLGGNREYLNRWVNRLAPLIESQMTQIRSLQAALSDADGIKCIPTWVHTNRSWAYPMSAGADLSASNNVKVRTVTDLLHWETGSSITTVGKRMVGNVWAAYIANAV